jgi:hypothetical protein
MVTITCLKTTFLTTISFAGISKRVSWAVENGEGFRIQAGCLLVNEAVCWGVGGM